MKNKSELNVKKLILKFFCSMTFFYAFSLYSMEKDKEEGKELSIEKIPEKVLSIKNFSIAHSLSIENKKNTALAVPKKPEKRKNSFSRVTFSINNAEEKEPKSSRGVPKRDIPDREQSYVDLAASLLKNNESASEASRILIYSYFIFTDDECFFSQLINLKQKYPKKIKVFLEQLACAAFPNGIQNLQLATSEYNELKRGIVNAPLFTMCLSNNFTLNGFNNENIEKISILINQTKNNEENNIKEKDLDIGGFTEALRARDLYLFQAIQPKDLKNYLENQSSPPESIRSLMRHFDLTSNWIALQIVSTREKSQRDKLIKKFFCIGRLFLEKNNFHGLMQIFTALSKPAVERLMSNEALNDDNWKAISAFLNHQHGFRKYRDSLSKILAESGCISIFPLLCSDLVHAYEGYKTSKSLQTKSNKLEELAKAIEVFFSYRTLSYPNIDPNYIKLVCGFKEVHGETIEVLSDICQDWGAHTTPTTMSMELEDTMLMELEKWTPFQFAFLLRENGCALQVAPIFKLGISEGAHIIDYMGKGNIHEKEEKLNELGINKRMVKDIILSHFAQRKEKIEQKEPLITNNKEIDQARLDVEEQKMQLLDILLPIEKILESNDQGF